MRCRKSHDTTAQQFHHTAHHGHEAEATALQRISEDKYHSQRNEEHATDRNIRSGVAAYHLNLFGDEQRYNIRKGYIYQSVDKHRIDTGHDIGSFHALPDTVQIIDAAVLRTVSCHSHTHCGKGLCHQLLHLAGDRIRCHHGRTQQIQCRLYQNSADSSNGKLQCHGNSHGQLVFHTLTFQSAMLRTDMQCRYALNNINQTQYTG